MRIGKLFTRGMAVLLTVTMLISALPSEALAYYAPDKPETISITDSDGKTVTTDSNWKTAFPYGTFAFSSADLNITEGGGEGKITVYRLGGTSGRATAYLTYVPVVPEISEGVKTYANAAGSGDVAIRVENPLPIAAYQPLGKDPDPLEPDPAVTVTKTDGETEESDVTLSVDVDATSYQWYIQTSADGDWKIVTGATNRDFVASPDDYASYDFRCVFTVDNTTYCSDTAKGEAYVRPAQEVLEEAPEGLSYDTTYTQLDLDDPDEYAGYAFALTFADGEWVKEIYVSSPDDDTSEADKFGMFTIAGCKGGSLYDSANTLLLDVADNDAPEASQIGFTVTSAMVDKSAGSASLTVKRTGGTQNPLSVDYETADGTAAAGTDYSSKSGTLMFYADVTEQTIEIPLIDDGKATEDLKDFTVTLSNLKGDSYGVSSLGDTVATVSLYNTATATKPNLATMVYDDQVVDVSGSVAEAPGTVAAQAGAVTGREVEKQDVGVEVTIEPVDDGGDLEPQTYNYPSKYSITRGSGYSGWRDWIYVARNFDISSASDNYGFISNWSSGSSYGSSGWKVESKGATSAWQGISNMSQLYKRFIGYFDWRAAIGSSLYDLEYTYPWFQLVKRNDVFLMPYASVDSGAHGGGDFWSGTWIEWYTSGSMDKSWNISDNLVGMYLGLSRYDCHDAKSTALAALKAGALQRRTFSNSLGLRIFTANDSGEGIAANKTSPDGAASLTEASSVYTPMKPTLEIAPGEGGVNTSGQLYVGSKLKVTLKTTDSFKPLTSNDLSYAVYLTREGDKTSTRVKADVQSGGNNIYFLTLRWDGMTDADLSGNYTVNVVMNRVQTLKVDLAPSVERLTDSEGKTLTSINPEKIDEAVSEFWSNDSDPNDGIIQGVTYGYSLPDGSSTHFTYKTDGLLNHGSLTQPTADSAVMEASNIQNLQWINFNREAEDIILYNGRAYAGNEKIYLTVSDLSQPNMAFRYYDKDYINAPSVMTTDISQTALYLDGNGNGRIDGYYNEYTGYFTLDEDSGDEFMFFLDPGVDYDESVFAPVAVLGTDGSGNTVVTGYRQYFLKAYYTMTPRCLTVPEGASENDPVQVLPAFVADVTDPSTYSTFTAEQQAYRYIISGKNRSYLPTGSEHNVVTPDDGDYARSSDNHAMYGAAATAISMVDIPLGGDHCPPVLDSEDETFTWSPDYHGSLLYKFSSPEPIYVPHSLAGDNIPIAEVSSIDASTGEVTYTDGALTAAVKLNGYLGSFTNYDTFALCVQEQNYTTDQIAAANGISIPDLGLQSDATDEPRPESVNLNLSGCFPNADYLKQANAANNTGSPNMDMSQSGNDFEEFNLDLGVNLPSTDVGITDYVTIIMDGYEVGFSIGLPLGGYNSNGDAGSGGTGGSGDGGSNWYGPKKANASNAEDMGKMKDFLKSPSMDSLWNTDDSMKEYNEWGKVKSSSFSVEFSVSIAFLFKYNSVDNAYCFSQFSVACSAELEYTYQYRLTPCPIVYLYVKVGISVEISTGMTVDREAVEEDTPVLPESGSFTLEKGHTYNFTTDKKAFNITFDGKVYIECADGNYATGSFGTPADGFLKGYIQSEGDDPVTVTLIKQDGNDLKDSGGALQTHTVRLTALEDTTLSRVARINDMRSDVYWNGFVISPEAFVEAGAGIGVEIMKFEVFVKVSIGCTMSLGVYNKDTKSYDPFEFNEFEFALGLGFRVVLLVFSYEMDLIQYTITYDSTRPENARWVHSWSALGGLYGGDIGTLSAEDGDGNSMPVRIKLPGDTSATQTIYSPDSGGDLSTQAYDASDKNVPFQLSGYGSSGDAFKLVDGLNTGYDYKVVTVGSDNYLVYTVGRDAATTLNEVDYTMLVLSRLKLTKAATSTEKDNYALVNPVNEASSTPYIILDDDGTGDLDFSVWVKDSTIHAAWVSYASASAKVPDEPTPPNSITYPKPIGTDDDHTPMDITNYTDTGLFPEPEEPPTAPTPPRPDPRLTDDRPTAAPDPTDTDKYPGGTSDTNYIADLALYNTWLLQDQWDAYDTNLASYISSGKQQTYNAYHTWYDYFEAKADVNAYYQTRAANAAKNTVIKTASFTVGSDTAFTTPVTVSGAVGSHVFLPDSAGNGSTVFYAKAVHYTDAEETTAAGAYSAYLTGAYPGTDDVSKNIRDYRALYQKGVRDAYGKGTELEATLSGATIGSLALGTGQTLENWEVMEAGAGVYYLAYTTSQQEYVAPDGKDDLLNVHRLILRKVTVDTSGSPATVDWGTAYLLRTVYDYDLNHGTDGVYSSGATLKEAYGEPYFANLQFLYGKLGALTGSAPETFTTLSATPENFLLFEMDGSTYIIPSEDLSTITSSGSGTIYPFFKPAGMTNADGSSATPSSTGRSEVTIGADGAGNISAVYVGAVPDTTNNALYLTKYDPSTSSWGSGTMLAMNYMQVYENSIKNGLTPEETEAAFLDSTKGGGMYQFVFSNLQVALGQTKTDVSPGSVDSLSETGSAANFDSKNLGSLTALSSDEQDELALADSTVTNDTLLVITQGMMTYLRQIATGSDPAYVIGPMSQDAAQAEYLTDTAANPKPGLGVYAISYGAGGQRIGEDTLSFVDYDFTAGSELKATVSFVNTGDVNIRGSEANPITVELHLITPSGNDATLDAWEISQNVASGQKVVLYGTTSALTANLPSGSIFYLAVREDTTYSSTPFTATTLVCSATNVPQSGTLTVAEKPELGFEHCEIKSVGVDGSGNTILNVDFQVGNRGNETATGVYVQFTYEDGEDSHGNTNYTPLSLKNSDLTISQQEDLKELDASTLVDLTNGILRLYNAADGDSIAPDKGRTVTGTITVPPSYYQGALTGSLNLHLEIFSSSDQITMLDAGTVYADHGEYNSVNNVMQPQIEQATYFTTADKVTLAMGNTLRLPVSIATTTGEKPQIIVEEIADGNDGAHNLGILYFSDDGNYANGHMTGTLVLAPRSEGSGIIHIMDTATNSIFAVTYSVTEAAEGINIYNDNDLFTFKNANGTAYDASASSQDWAFQDKVSVWGSGDDAEMPYLGNLAVGAKDSSFTFRTVAQSIDLYFYGTVQVSSTFPNFSTVTVSAAGGKTKATVFFGSNSTNYPHDVTVTVTSDTGAQFDRLVEHYSSGVTPTPSDDADSPHIYWSRSFPDTASIQTGSASVSLTCYVLDGTGLAAVTVNGSEPTLTKNGDGFWQFNLTVTANGTLSVAAQDSAGNRTARTVTVDWFNDSVSTGAKATAPTLDGLFVKDGSELTGYVKKGETAYLRGEAASGSTVTANYIAAVVDPDTDASFLSTSGLSAANPDPFEPSGDDWTYFQASSNGYYQLTATAADGTWSSVVLTMDKIDAALPTVTLSETTLSGQRVLSWSVSKGSTSLSPITSVKINGEELTIPTGETWVSGTLPVSFAGAYTLEAADSAGNGASTTFTVQNYHIDLNADGVFAVTHSWNQDRNNGSIAIDGSKITGGSYASRVLGTDGKNTYSGSYEYALVSGAEDFSFDEPAATASILAQYTADHPEAPDMPADALALALSSQEAAARVTWLSGLTWSASALIENLVPSQYVLYVRDAQETGNALVVATQSLTINDEAVTFTMSSTPAVYISADNGTIDVVASGGRLARGTYQFAIRPMQSKDAALVGAAGMTSDPSVTWQLSDVASGSLNTASLSGLRTGWYEVAVRAMEVPSATMENLSSLYTVFINAQTALEGAQKANTESAFESAAASKLASIRTAQQMWDNAATPTEQSEREAYYKSLIDSDSTILSLLQNWLEAEDKYTAGTMTREDADAVKALYDAAVNAFVSIKVQSEASAQLLSAQTALSTALSNYSSAASAASAVSDTAYAATPALWDNACSDKIHILYLEPSIGGVSMNDFDFSRSGFVQVSPVRGTLSDTVQKALLGLNGEYSIIITGDGLQVVIPRGTLSQGDNIMSMLLIGANLPDDPTGYAVQCVTPDGTTYIVPLCRITSDSLAYFATRPGTYSIVYRPTAFGDVVSGFWGEGAISFVCANGLFQGTGNNTFGPNVPMTRAMLVTVLGRMMDIDLTQYGGSSFSDVSADAWYGAYVRWASENGIINGYSTGAFGPNDIVTREQMCAILVRFLDAQGFTLPEGEDGAFADADSISSWAKDAVEACRNTGLIQGVGGNLANPGGQSSRAEVATVIMRLIFGLLGS